MTDIPTLADVSHTDVLDFWFDDLSPSDHFNGSDSVDARIRDRFGTLVEALEAAGYPHAWEATPASALALVLALDQFPRNIHRGSAGAYLLDTVALDVAMRAIGLDYLQGVARDRRKWFLMPLMHSEDLAVQDAAIPLFATHADADTLAHAKAHREQIARFDRFPGRNAALHRDSTDAERDYLESGGYKALLEAARAA